jgi:hypothetical protein
MNQLFALEPSDIKPVELVFFDGEARDRQGLPLAAGNLDPIVNPTGIVSGVTDLRNNAFKSHLVGLLEHGRAIGLKALDAPSHMHYPLVARRGQPGHLLLYDEQATILFQCVATLQRQIDCGKK